jgi:hypothetical protein
MIMAMSLLVENSQVIINIALNASRVSCLSLYLPNGTKQSGNTNLSNEPHYSNQP